MRPELGLWVTPCAVCPANAPAVQIVNTIAGQIVNTIAVQIVDTIGTACPLTFIL